MYEPNDIANLVEACRRNDRAGQEKLYKALYRYGMSICVRYSRSDDDALEVLNDGFLKIFTRLDKFVDEVSFIGWARRIWINSAIDQFRRSKPRFDILDISYARNDMVPDGILDKLATDDIMRSVQALPPAYRLIFNLYVIDGYNHREIAEMLSISEGTSKSNLAKARMKLKRSLASMDKERYSKHG